MDPTFLNRIANTNEDMPSRTVLEDVIRRGVIFLSAMSKNPPIRTLVEAVGYSPAVHAEGWKLFFLVSGFEPGKGDVMNVAAEAHREINSWQAVGFTRAHAALKHKHPEQAQFVFGDLGPSRGPEAIASMALFLDRCAALHSGEERKATRKADRAALETLASRGITDVTLNHLRDLVQLVSIEATGTQVAPANTAKLAADQLALYRWLEDWIETTKTVVSKRSDLIKLGIIRRRKKAAKAVVGAPVTAPVTAPAEPAAPVAAPPVVTPAAAAPFAVVGSNNRPMAPTAPSFVAAQNTGAPLSRPPLTLVEGEEKSPDSRRTG